MNFNLEETVKTLLTHPYFEKAKKVREVNAGHTEDSVFTHLMQTADMARQSVDGNFIINPQAKELFLEFMSEEKAGIAYRDLAVIVATIHDIGKILSFKEDANTFPMNIQNPNAEVGNTYNPGHEYWGSQLIPGLLKNLSLPDEVVEYITSIVRMHGQVFDFYPVFMQFPLEEAIRDMKSRVGGYHLEVLFNSYCDCTYNKPLQPCRELIVQMFNHPDTYSPREYFVA